MRYDRLQLALPFEHQPRYQAADFLAADSNQHALAWLATDWPEQRLALFGPAGCGKSHLLHVWAGQSDGVVLPGQTLHDLDAMPMTGALALDDADTVANEELLFHVLNTARDRGLRLLLSGQSPPARWPVHLPDLSSRLRAITAVEIHPPSDELLAALLKRLAAERQLTMTPPAENWILLHLPRSPAVMREALALLDRETLVIGGRITRTLAMRVLEPYVFANTDPDEILMAEGAPSSEGQGFL